MNTEEHIKSLCSAIVRRFRPHKVILFGSFAASAQTENSDIDLLVVMPYDGSEMDKMIEIRRTLSSEMPLDVLVKTPAQIANADDRFLSDIIMNGRVLYDTGDIGLDR